MPRMVCVLGRRKAGRSCVWGQYRACFETRPVNALLCASLGVRLVRFGSLFQSRLEGAFGKKIVNDR